MFMINPTTATPTYQPKNVMGPYSAWPRQPRQPRQPRRSFVASGVIVAAIGIFLHCGLPLIA